MGSTQGGETILNVPKIDEQEVNGLLGVHDSLAYRVHEIEKHFHNNERWVGKLAVQTATDWAADNLSPFRAISGNNTWGADPNDEAQVLGTDDTPIQAGMVKYDPHQLMIVAASSTTIYKLRLVYGTGTMADAITAGQYTEIMVKYDPAVGETSAMPIPLIAPRCDASTYKLWVQAWNATDNATIDFFIGIHEYLG